MYKAHRIILFLMVFLAVVLLPVLVNLGHEPEAPALSLDTPQINSLKSSQCVETAEFMRADHMQLLEHWRTAAVRLGHTDYTSSSGQVYAASLDTSCLGCHSNRAEFCDSCHSYLATNPNCWSCHDGGDGGAGA